MPNRLARLNPALQGCALARSSGWPKGLAFLALAVFAAWLRLRHLGYAEFGPDQSVTLAIALDWLHGGPLPLASIKSSLGLFNPPLVEYLFAIPLAFSPNIVGVVWLIALLNLAGVGVACWATARVFGARVAWWSALLFVVNPWAVFYGQFIWMQSFVPGFSALAYAMALMAFAGQPHPRYVILCALFLAATVQLHLSGVALIVALGALAACFYKRIAVSPLIVGAALFALSFAPFALFEIQNGFPDWVALGELAQQPSQVDFASALNILDLLQSKGVYQTLGSAASQWQSLDMAWLQADAWVIFLIVASILVAVALVIQDWRRVDHLSRLTPPATGQLLSVIWLVVPALLYLRHSFHFQTYYSLYVFPAPFVLMALAGDQAARWLSARLPAERIALGRAAQALAFVPLALVIFQQARLMLIGQDLLASGVSGRQPVVDVQRAIDAANNLVDACPDCQLVVLSEGGTHESSSFGLMREAVNARMVRFVQSDSAILLPDGGAIYFLSMDARLAREWLDAYAAPVPQAEIATPERTWRFYRLAAESRDRVLVDWGASASQAEWGNGLRLNRVDLSSRFVPGSILRIAATWTVDALKTPPRRLHLGNYLLTPDNQVVAQIDGPGLDSLSWQPGDIFQTVFRMELPADLPPGEHRLAIVFYEYPSLERVWLADGSADMFIAGQVTIVAP